MADPRWLRAYWQGTALLLAAHFAGWAAALPLVVLLNVLQVNHLVVLRRSLTAFDVQVRVGYLALLALGSVGSLWPLHVVQFIGVNVMLVTDYCLLARLLVLLPGNRAAPMSWQLLRWALLSPPAAGALTARVPAWLARAATAGPGCLPELRAASRRRVP